MKKTLKVSGMTCDSCAEKISKNLYSLAEVDHVTVDFDNGTVELELDDVVSNDLLKTVVKNSGKYEVTEII